MVYLLMTPSLTDEETAKERLKKAESGEIKCFDWWFCHKKILEEETK
jgi:peroxiredoxin (alkyl hydroperoxide reductase subunit C)